MTTEITQAQIVRFQDAKAKFDLLKPVEAFGMRPVLSVPEKVYLNKIISEVDMAAILDHISANTFEAADSCDGEGRDALISQASTICAAALFCRTWGKP